MARDKNMREPLRGVALDVITAESDLAKQLRRRDTKEAAASCETTQFHP
jgi:hypothetical protein